MVSLGKFDSRGAGISNWGDLRVCGRCRIDHLRHLVLPKDEATPDHRMKTRLIGTPLLVLGFQMNQALACSVCFTAPNSETGQHMAAAVWVLMGVVMSVMGGVGAFTFHLWRHANTPLAPHQQLAEEDLDQYE